MLTRWGRQWTFQANASLTASCFSLLNLQHCRLSGQYKSSRKPNSREDMYSKLIVFVVYQTACPLWCYCCFRLSSMTGLWIRSSRITAAYWHWYVFVLTSTVSSLCILAGRIPTWIVLCVYCHQQHWNVQRRDIRSPKYLRVKKEEKKTLHPDHWPVLTNRDTFKLWSYLRYYINVSFILQCITLNVLNIIQVLHRWQRFEGPFPIKYSADLKPVDPNRIHEMITFCGRKVR